MQATEDPILPIHSTIQYIFTEHVATKKTKGNSTILELAIVGYSCLLYNTSSRPRVKHIISGAAQEFILGPDLSNINYDRILRDDMPEGTFLVGYADDIAAIATARNTEEARITHAKTLSKLVLMLTINYNN